MKHTPSIRVERDDRKALPYRAVCSCGWRSDNRYAEWHRAETDGDDHAEISHEKKGS